MATYKQLRTALLVVAVWLAMTAVIPDANRSAFPKAQQAQVLAHARSIENRLFSSNELSTAVAQMQLTNRLTAYRPEILYGSPSNWSVILVPDPARPYVLPLGWRLALLDFSRADLKTVFVSATSEMHLVTQADATDARTTLIRRAIQDVHRELIQLAPEHPQLDGIERASVSDTEMIFINGELHGNMTAITNCTHSNATLLLVRVLDIAGRTDDPITQHEMRFTNANISVEEQVITCPEGQNVEHFRAQALSRIEKVIERLLSALAENRTKHGEAVTQ
jgi:hypothetical protein